MKEAYYRGMVPDMPRGLFEEILGMN